MKYQPGKYLRLYYEGVGNVNYQIPPSSSPPPTNLNADEGIFFDTGDTFIKWGTDSAGSGVPFTEDRKVDFAGNVMDFDNARIIWNAPQNFTQTYNLTGAGTTIERVFTGSSNNPNPFERQINTTAGVPTDDNVYIQGWNIDSGFDGSLPSWTSRLEYRFDGAIYEYHDPQWSSPVGARTYRLMSFTFTDLGSPATDLSDIFMRATSFEMRDLANNIAFFLVEPGVGGGSSMSLIDPFSGDGFTITASGTGTVNIFKEGSGTFEWQFDSTLSRFNLANEVVWDSSDPNAWSGVTKMNVPGALFTLDYAGSPGQLNLTTSGKTLKITNQTFNADFTAPDNAGGFTFETGDGTPLLDIVLSASGGIACFQRLITPASVAAAGSLIITSGVTPTTPLDGEIWYDGTNLKMRVGATTKTFTLV